MDQQIICLYESHSPPEIARLLNCNIKTIRKHIKEIGLPTNRRRHLRDERDHEIIALFSTHQHSYEDIMKLVGCGRNTIIRCLKRHAIPTRKPAEWTRLYEYDEKFFREIDSPTKAYWVGFLMADGCVIRSNNNGSVTVHVSEKDMAVLTHLRSDLCSNLPIGPTATGVRLSVGSVQMADDLIRLGVTPNKTGHERFPFAHLIEAYHPDFIRGFFDGDGCVHIRKSRNHIPEFILASKSKQILTDVRQILESNCDLNQNKISGSQFFYLRYSGRQVKSIYDYLYYNKHVRCLDRKHQIFKSI